MTKPKQTKSTQTTKIKQVKQTSKRASTAKRDNMKVSRFSYKAALKRYFANPDKEEIQSVKQILDNAGLAILGGDYKIAGIINIDVAAYNVPVVFLTEDSDTCGMYAFQYHSFLANQSYVLLWLKRSEFDLFSDAIHELTHVLRVVLSNDWGSEEVAAEMAEYTFRLAYNLLINKGERHVKIS